MNNSASTKRASTNHTAVAKVLVADDHHLVRDGIKVLVAEVLGDVHFLEADDGDSLMHAMDSGRNVRLALIDLRMPGMQGGLRLDELARRHPNTPLVVVSTSSPPDVVRRTLDIPTVHAFVAKNAGRCSMRSAIEAAMQGKKLPFTQVGRSTPVVHLTSRQEQVRGLMRQGMSNKAIAGALGISEGTVKNHITEIFRVLHATNRTQAAQLDVESE